MHDESAQTYTDLLRLRMVVSALQVKGAQQQVTREQLLEKLTQLTQAPALFRSAPTVSCLDAPSAPRRQPLGI